MMKMEDKKYENPELNIVLFTDDDIITLSGEYPGDEYTE